MMGIRKNCLLASKDYKQNRTHYHIQSCMLKLQDNSDRNNKQFHIIQDQVIYEKDNEQTSAIQRAQYIGPAGERKCEHQVSRYVCKEVSKKSLA